MRKPMVSALALLMLLSLTSMAFASTDKGSKKDDGTVQPQISAITNEFTASNQNPKKGEVVYFQSTTTYDWQYLPNPYTSNYLTAIPFSLFQKPTITAYQLPSGWVPSFSYLSFDSYIGEGSWRYHSGDGIWFTTKDTFSITFNAKAYSSYTTICDDGKGYHGQTNNSNDSRGTPVTLILNVCP